MQLTRYVLGFNISLIMLARLPYYADIFACAQFEMLVRCSSHTARMYGISGVNTTLANFRIVGATHHCQITNFETS